MTRKSNRQRPVSQRKTRNGSSIRILARFCAVFVASWIVTSRSCSYEFIFTVSQTELQAKFKSAGKRSGDSTDVSQFSFKFAGWRHIIAVAREQYSIGLPETLLLGLNCVALKPGKVTCRISREL